MLATLSRIDERVSSGSYGNTSEYLRELIRKDQAAQRIEHLRALVEDGLASGPAVVFDATLADEMRSHVFQTRAERAPGAGVPGQRGGTSATLAAQPERAA